MTYLLSFADGTVSAVDVSVVLASALDEICVFVQSRCSHALSNVYGMAT